jgi:hypothetical protein
MGTMNRGGTDIFGKPTQVRGMGGMQNPNGGQNSMGMMTCTIGGSGVGATAPTASTAETALSRLNLNKQYAQGGTVAQGGMQDLYSTSDNLTPPQLSQDGYGLGRLQAMAQGGAMGYAKGGETKAMVFSMRDQYGQNRNDADSQALSKTIWDQLGKKYAANPQYNASTQDPSAQPIVDYLNSFRTTNSDALRGGNLNLNTASGLGMAKGGYLDGPGDGMSDSIPATIEGKQPARLADGEFVIPADVVSHLGNGSTKAGSHRLYGMLDKVRKARTGTKKQGKQINPSKYMPA